MALSRSEAFGVALKKLREARGLSQEAAALACGIDRAYFGKLERGQKSPTLAMVWKISDGLDTRPSKLMAQTERLVGK